MIELVGERDGLRGLSDLKRIGHVGDARHSWQKTVRLGEIGGLAIGEVFLLLCQSRGQVRDLVALHDAQSRGDAQLPRVVLNVPGGRIQGLPDTVEIGLSIGQFARSGSRGFSGGRSLRQRGNLHQTQAGRDGRKPDTTHSH